MNKLFAHIIVVFFISVNLLSVSFVFADDKIKLRGEPFSDPSQSSSMPEDWKNQTIRYIPDFMKADIVIDLNQQINLFLEPLIQEYGRVNDLKIITTTGTCGKSAGKIDRKEMDIGGFCCPPEKKDRLPGLSYHTMGISPLAFFVNPDNPVRDVTLKQLRQIFQGTITNWSELGGRDLPIKKIVSFHCKHRPGHWRLLLESPDFFSPDVLETGDMEDMIAFVASNPGAIGYETLVVADRFKHRGDVHELRINGYSPIPENLIGLNYSIYRTFNLTTWEGEKLRNPYARKLVDYMIKETAGLDKKVGILPASSLKKAGWKFNGTELIGEPDHK